MEVLGVGVDRLTRRQAVARAVELATTRPGSFAVTPNAELVWAAQSDSELRQALNQADLAVADGAGVVWACRILGTPVPERVAGYDLMTDLLAAAAEQDLGVFLIGGRPGVAELAAAQARRRFPALSVLGFAHGYFSAAEETAMCADVKRVRPAFLFVGIGAPRQEKWLARNLFELGAGLAMGVGGGLDVLAGRVARAPSWVIRLNLEWLYRLVREPARLRRQAALPAFAIAVLRRRLTWGRGRRPPH
ncbi:MAG TPA: WecB/TagA/CpsF family glycosyltransferase [Bacillota bacterium]|nr:WecB/TagA/CpsF family glycosyltransferase [Bacillota bacterium]